jgi:hypothetical protein
VKPVQCARYGRDQLRTRISASNVRQLVSEYYAPVLIGPLERIVRQQDRRTENSPGNGSADSRARREQNEFIHADNCHFVFQTFPPFAAREWPRSAHYSPQS